MRLTVTVVLVTLAVTTGVAVAALPGSDYSYVSGSKLTVTLDVAGRTAVDNIGFQSLKNSCVRGDTATEGRRVAIKRKTGTFKAKRGLESIASGKRVGSLSFRGRFTSKKRLVLRLRFLRGKCRSHEFRFVMRGVAPSG